MHRDKKIRLSGLDLEYKSGCDCDFCKINRNIYQNLVRKIFGRYEHSPSKRELFINDFKQEIG